MSYTGGGRDLDIVTFSDECFPSFVSLNQSHGRGEVETDAYNQKAKAAPKATRTAEVLTETLYYADAETNTKYKKKEVEVSVMPRGLNDIDLS